MEWAAIKIVIMQNQVLLGGGVGEKNSGGIQMVVVLVIIDNGTQVPPHF